ncbi:NUDIX hydrolase domain-like protein [Mycena floridula]|nr:NUDIX hydrolase domain-like protein [Mycena floridula]
MDSASSSRPRPIQQLVSRLTRPLPRPLSRFSSPAVPNSGWSSQCFMLGAGMVIFQPSTNRVVLVHDTEYGFWFLPKGRKDLGESLETTALREAYEESGYKASFFPMFSPSNQPAPPEDMAAIYKPNTEPIFISTHTWAPSGRREYGGEYITHWYAGHIPADAIRVEGTGMPDEQNYTSFLLSFDEAVQRLHEDQVEQRVLQYAIAVYTHHHKVLEVRAQKEEEIRLRARDEALEDPVEGLGI